MKTADGFYITTDKSLLDLEVISEFLAKQSYWAKGRSREAIEKSIAHSTCFGLFNSQNQQAGFARVVTDFTVFAWLMDVFVLDAYRGNGLGKMLMQEIMKFGDQHGIRRWGLGTRDAHGLYQQFGFRLLENPGNMMERTL